MAGEWFADPANLGLRYPGRVMWDAFLLFGREARWEDAPSHLLASGWTVIGNTEKLETALAAHLAEVPASTPAAATPGSATPAAATAVTIVADGLAKPRDFARPGRRPPRRRERLRRCWWPSSGAPSRP
ncbi:MAG: hypothetical protein H0W06_02545 [Chloroflexia bacterium]|nr:hypothetical protein [Chloroflexia bacterium]